MTEVVGLDLRCAVGLEALPGALRAWSMRGSRCSLAQMAKGSSRGADRGTRTDRAIHLLLAALIVGGVAVRAYDLGYPEELTWDEPHFVENARNLLEGKPDWNDHPPLGKLLIATGILAMGDNGIGWRIAPLVFGLALIALAFALGTSAFRSKTAGLYAAAFVAASGFVIAFSKTALLDGMLTTLMVAAGLALWRAHSWVGICSAAALIGLSMSIKFTGVVLCLPLIFLAVYRLGVAPKTLCVLILGFAVMAAVYVAQFSLGLALGGDEYGVVDVLRKTTELVRHHIGLQDWKHPATSRWYTWFIPLKTIRLHYVRNGDTVRAMTTSGNPILWWGINWAVLWTAFELARQARNRRLLALADAPPWASAQRYLLLLWFLPLCPWIFTNRDSYIYHYLPSYAFGLVLFGCLVSTLANPKVRLALVALIAVVFFYCARVWGKIPLDADSLLHKIFFR